MCIVAWALCYLFVPGGFGWNFQWGLKTISGDTCFTEWQAPTLTPCSTLLRCFVETSTFTRGVLTHVAKTPKIAGASARV